MKPCLECVKKYGKNVCSHNGCCALEDVPGVSPEKILGTLNEDWVDNRRLRN